MKGIVIDTLAVSTPFILEEPILEGADVIIPSIDVPVEGLNEEEHVALALRASMDTTRAEQAAGISSFI